MQNSLTPAGTEARFDLLSQYVIAQIRTGKGRKAISTLHTTSGMHLTATPEVCEVIEKGP